MQTHFPPSSVAASWQALGNGYRIYNPALMRFHSPDAWSPFGEGGPNAYAYAVGDPVNHLDPSGHFVIHVPQFVALIAITVASLGAAGIAVNTTNDTQRVLSSIASALAGIGTVAMGRYMYRKGRARPKEVPTSTPGATQERVLRSSSPAALPQGEVRNVEVPFLVPPGHKGDQVLSPHGWTPRAERKRVGSGSGFRSIRDAYAVRGQGH